MGQRTQVSIEIPPYEGEQDEDSHITVAQGLNHLTLGFHDAQTLRSELEKAEAVLLA